MKIFLPKNGKMLYNKTLKGAVPMNIKYLSYFTKIVETGSYAAVSRKVYISQPGLFKAMRSLENALGVRLLEQQDRKTIVTPEGALIYPIAKKICTEYDQMLAMLGEFGSDNQRTIRFGFSSPAILPSMMSYILSFMEQNPEVNLTMVPHVEDRICNLLLTDQLEFALGLFTDQDDLSAFSFCTLDNVATWGCVLSSNDPLARRKRITINDLAGYTVILPTYTNHWTKTVQQIFANSDLPERQIPTYLFLPDSMWNASARRKNTVYFTRPEKWQQGGPMGLSYLSLDGDPLRFSLVLFCRKGKQLSAEEKLFWDGAQRLSVDRRCLSAPDEADKMV
jgi:LysR family carnitine catabolism transcriptional activator